MNHSIVYRDYCDSDVDALVQMWKESRPGWPPGFFSASETTASSVAREEKSSGRLFSALAFSGDRVVGYCRTSPYGGEAEASYVDLINVVPDMHGAGIGKALLLDAVKRSVKFGMKRIDLHTWSANMKAVPLYKKTGFFWVPETMVYMQNYMPFLLGREEFLDFLSGEDWYKCFERALAVESDTEKTNSGREIFRYVFKRDADSFVAEFDRKGRCLSLMEYPGFSAGLSVESASEFFVGRSYSVSLSGSGFNPEKISVDCGKSLKCPGVSADAFAVEPLPVRIAKTPYEPADRLTVSLKEKGLEFGIGIVGVEEVALHSPVVRFLSPGAEKLRLGLKKLGDVSSVVISYALDEGEFYSRVVALNSDIYQSCTVELPPVEQGVHILSVRLGESGYLETVVLVAGVYSGRPLTVDTRKSAVIVGSDVALTVSRRGAAGRMWGRGPGDAPISLGRYFVSAGPPSVWNSDLPKQIYKLELDNGEVIARTVWPSRPGLTHWVSARLDPAGFLETAGGVDNGSDSVQKVLYRVRKGAGEVFEPGVELIPLSDGLLAEPGIHNQIPDWEEDIPPLVSGLGAPWTGVAGEEKSLMHYFPGWIDLEYSMPGTPEVDVAPGETLVSPPFHMLYSEGGIKSLMRKAESLGWDVGNWRERVPFLNHNLQPVMASGTEVSLSHLLCGERDAEIAVGGKIVCTGKIRADASVSGRLAGEGTTDVSLTVAERTTVIPVCLVNSPEKVEAGRDDAGFLYLSNNRIKVLIDPCACGHVYSVKLDGVEYILSSHPEPSEFAWEKPWFGGIHPRISGQRGNPYLLQDEKPETEEYQRELDGLIERGWLMTWRINHKKYGSLKLDWRVGLVPGVPVLKTSLECEASSGEYLDGNLSVKGFIQPGGSVANSILTCEKFPGLAQGRNHAGAWAHMGKWARVGRKNSFVEAYSGEDGVFYCEDFGKQGCHLSLFSSHDRKKTLDMTWLFGDRDDDATLASVFRAHR